jgi:hypothetical protein
MIRTISLFQLGICIMLIMLSGVIIARRRAAGRQGVIHMPASKGGSPLWLWVVIAVWASLSLIVALALLLTGHAKIDF